MLRSPLYEILHDYAILGEENIIMEDKIDIYNNNNYYD